MKIVCHRAQRPGYTLTRESPGSTNTDVGMATHESGMRGQDKNVKFNSIFWSTKMNPLKTVRLVKLHMSYVSFVPSSFCSGTKATTKLKKEPSNSTRRKCRMLKLFIQRDGNRPVVTEEVDDPFVFLPCRRHFFRSAAAFLLISLLF